MASDYVHQMYMFVNAPKNIPLGQYFSGLPGCCPSDANGMCTLPYSLLGILPITFYGARFLMTDDQMASMSTQMPSYPLMKYYRCDLGGVLKATNSLTAALSIGQVYTYQQAASDMGLLIIFT